MLSIWTSLKICRLVQVNRSTESMEVHLQNMMVEICKQRKDYSASIQTKINPADG